MVHLFGKSKQSTVDHSLIQGKVHCFTEAVCDTLFIRLKGILNTLQNQQKFTAEMLSVPYWAEIVAEESNLLDCREWLWPIGQIQAVERNKIILIWATNNNAQQEVNFLNQNKTNGRHHGWDETCGSLKILTHLKIFWLASKLKKNIWGANKGNVITHTRKSAKIHLTVGQWVIFAD